MKPATVRLVSVAALLSGVSLIGFVLAFVFQWPSRFVIGGADDSRVTLGDLISGTVTSIPLAPWVLLIVCSLLARSRRWWGTLAVAVLCLLGALFIVGAWGEAFGPENPDVPRSVLAAAGAVYGLLGLSLLFAGVRDLVERMTVRHAAARDWPDANRHDAPTDAGSARPAGGESSHR